MQEIFRPDLDAHVTIGDDQRVREIRHSQKYWELPPGNELEIVRDYLRRVAEIYEIPPARLENLTTRVEYLEPREQPPEYRLSDEKHHFDATTYGFDQTYLNVPVWRAGLKVTVKRDPDRVIRSVDTSVARIQARLPDEAAIERFRRPFAVSTAASLAARAARGATGEESGGAAQDGGIGAALLAEVFRLGGGEEAGARLRLIRGRFWIYRYDAAARLAEPGKRAARGEPPIAHGASGETAHDHFALPFPIPPVDESIRDGADYLVGEVTFEVADERHRFTWRALIELETGSILYLRSLADCLNALVFENDPITKTGNTALNSASDSATLNLHVDDVTLPNLAPPAGGIQSLTGTYAYLTQVEGPDIPPPTEATGTDFDYDVRTDNFASVSGYFHVDRIFRIMEDLGFTVSEYMANTIFPVPVDIRCYADENEINAHCIGDGMGGIDHVGYGIMDKTDLVNKLGRACDPRVHLHEVLGHGILHEHTGDGNFHFSHSAGDGLSGIYFDPESNCKGVDGAPVGKPGDLRFTYVPWHPSLNRRFDRAVADGWAWGGWRDNGGGADYGAEQILATTHFSIYRSIGGDSANLGRRQFASRMTMYLILRAIQNLTAATNPHYAREFAAELMTVDALNWTSEGIYGGAYHKVIRWAFEKQGEYQSPLIVTGGPGDGTIVSAGNPPEVDVYIDDGRAGEYPYQPVHWNTTAIWNRQMADGVDGHLEPALGATNYAYVKIKNRGTQQATDVVVRAYHTKPGAGLNWPADFEPLATAQIDAGTLEGNNAEEKIVGPFEWTPTINAYGHDCMLMVVSAAGDPSNVDNFTADETIPEWRLVPNDNNIGQRNVAPVPGGNGESGLVAGLDGVGFWVGNPNPRRARMTIEVTLPEILRERGWRIELEDVAGKGFDLEPGAKREIVIRVHPGADFATREVEASADRDIQIAVLADDNVIGGMTYRLDPNIRQPFNAARPGYGGNGREPAGDEPGYGGDGPDPERGRPMRWMVIWLIVAALAIAAIVLALTRWPTS